jgi:hypothetical protein
MARETGLSHGCASNPRGARHRARNPAPHTSHEGIGVKRACIASPELAPVASFGLGASPRSFFSQLDINYLPMWALWSCGRRPSVVQAQRQIHRVFAGHLHRRWPDKRVPSSSPRYRARSRRTNRSAMRRIRGSPLGASSLRKLGGTVKIFRGAAPLSNPWLEPIVDCGFDARRTSHPVAVLRAAGTTIPHSGGHRAREGGSTLYFGISQPLFATARPPGSNAADQASWNS